LGIQLSLISGITTTWCGLFEICSIPDFTLCKEAASVLQQTFNHTEH
jgi:hypothetical protein